MGPNSTTIPVKLVNFSMVTTYVPPQPQRTSDDPNGGVVEVVPTVTKLPSKQQLCWWKLLLGFVTEPVTVAETDRRSMITGLPTAFVNATSSEGVDLPGGVRGVADQTFL
jgi:hypothetical protein